MTFSSSLPILKLNNGENLKLNIGRETILSSKKQAPIHVDTAINKCPKKLRQETVLNKSQEIKTLKVTGRYSKQETALIHSFMQHHKLLPNMISFTYFTSQANLNSNQKIAPQIAQSASQPLMTTLVVIVDFI